jgi:hypothetical protein
LGEDFACCGYPMDSLAIGRFRIITGQASDQSRGRDSQADEQSCGDQVSSCSG